MQIIPVIPAIKDDELLISYFYRLAKANGKYFSNDCYTDYFTNEWHGLGPTLENLAKQMDNTDVIDLFLDHTTFLYEQLFMTRQQHKDIVNDIFNPVQGNGEPSTYLHNDFRYVNVCRDCLEEDFYIRRNHQLPSGYCKSHNKKTHEYGTTNVFQSGITFMESQRIPHPENLPTGLDLQMISIAEEVMRDHITLNFEEIMDIVEKNFIPSLFFGSKNGLEIEDYDRVWFGVPYDTQCVHLSEAFYMYEKFKGTDTFGLQDYPNLTLGLLAESVHTVDNLKKALPITEETYPILVIDAAKLGYRLVTESVQPLMRIKDVTNGLTRIVSIYSILDGEI